ARNVGLILLAVLIAANPTTEISTLTLVLAVAALASSGVALALARELRRARAASEPGSSVVPATALDYSMTTTAGGVISLRRLLQNGRRQLVVFIDPICGPCRALLGDLRPYLGPDEQVAVTVISRGPLGENADLARE